MNRGGGIVAAIIGIWLVYQVAKSAISYFRVPENRARLVELSYSSARWYVRIVLGAGLAVGLVLVYLAWR